MSEQSVSFQASSLRDQLRSLIEAMEGVIDMGITACVMGEERMAGYWELLRRYTNNVQSQLQWTVDGVKRLNMASCAEVDVSQQIHDLSSTVQAFLQGFNSLMRHRIIDNSTLTDAILMLRSGWGQTCQVVDVIISDYHLGDLPVRSEYHQRILDTLSVDLFKQE